LKLVQSSAFAGRAARSVITTSYKFPVISSCRYSSKNEPTESSNDPSAVDAKTAQTSSIKKEGNTPMEVDSAETLQPHWASMEKRVIMRKARNIGDGPRGRSNKTESAWDAENV
jgi:hypothetical protein